MNYNKIYKSLINKGLERGLNKKKVGFYTEKHHIVPKSMGGSEDKSNFVLLTAREHFVAHQLLYKIHKNRSMAHAMINMCADSTGNRVNSKLLDWHRKAKAKAQSEMVSGENHPMYNKKHKKETLEKMRLAKLGVPWTEEVKESRREELLKTSEHARTFIDYKSGGENPAAKKICIEGIVFDYMEEAVPWCNITRRTLLNRIKSSDPKWRDWNYV
ncbi:baseplate hub subunit and tail lysozyme [Escherichia phage vB_EcoM_ESCO10]|nr:baseplate hub subunit and tail lysozyme [Escherichia phage vB_EcoM_ESCO10]